MKTREQTNVVQLVIDFGIDLNLQYEIDFSDDDIFGSDDAAYENFSVLQSYSVERTSCKEYLNEKKEFMVLCAPKGTGKTTLVRLWQYKLSLKRNYVSIIKFDAQISPDLKSNSLSTWIRAWKRNIVYAIYLTLTNNKHYGVKPEDLKFIETVERRGVNKQNLIELIIEHIPKSKLLGVREIENKKSMKIWVFLDEIDQYFRKTEQDILKIASMLIACREMTSYISNVNIRTTIKPNVWAILRAQVSSMANLRELVIKYKWDSEGIKAIIAKRVESYIRRKYYSGSYHSILGYNYLPRDMDWLINQLFDPEKDFDLSKKKNENRSKQVVPPHKTLSTLGNYRPRWVLAMCKGASREALKRKNSKISIEHIYSHLPDFGKERIKDLASEYRTQCDSIVRIINSFYKGNSNFSNMQYLIDRINENIISKFDVCIEGVSEQCNAKQILEFLFEIGFVQPKNWVSKQRFNFIAFEDNPILLEGDVNNKSIYDDLIWEIHPSFRNILSLDRTPHNKIFRNSTSNFHGKQKIKQTKYRSK